MLINRPRPVTDQVVSLLDERIRSGHYPSGQRLPSEAELAEEFGVSRNTVRTALTRLATAGLIQRKHGSGTYVRQIETGAHSLIDAAWEYKRMIAASGRTPSIKGVSVEKRPATPEEAEALELEPGAPVVAVLRLFFADEQPVIRSLNISPQEKIQSPLESLDPDLGIHEFLEQYCRQRIAYADVEFSAVLADQEVQDALNVPPLTPLIQIRELFFDINDAPLVFALNVHHDTALRLRHVRPWYE
jgi:DNA-binding GntR family transcriptional regulator